jgi:uncharacterized protein (DUF2147 family)
MIKLIAAAILAASAGLAHAQASPVGLWKSIDDETKQEKSLVRIVDNGGTLIGRIERLLDPTKADAKCDKCTDARKDKPITGLQIIEGVKKVDGDEHWDGGHILDPNNGKVYRLRLTPRDGGKKLEVRGYVGAPLLGRSQTWIRME